MSSMEAQSAMEYLMTYGWAILIIAVVLGVLFQLGVFGGGLTAGGTCVAAPGFYCQNAALLNAVGDNGLQLTFGQSIGVPIYNIAMACAATANALGYPAGAAFNDISAAGSWLPSLGTSGASLVSGQTINIGIATTTNNIPCIGANGRPVGVGSAIGTSFSGFLWMNYTLNPGSVAPTTNPWYTVKVATINARVT